MDAVEQRFGAVKLKVCEIRSAQMALSMRLLICPIWVWRSSPKQRGAAGFPRNASSVR